MSQNSTPITSAPNAEAKSKADSAVDGVFDAVTAWAAQGLDVARRGLEASARWLDGRAKIVGDLATKLASSPRGEAPTETTETQGA